ncbi:MULTISPECIES: restriction endonuclease subunit S [unclassified Sulfurospirillum]|uniref:restriction endonuclease subunit S n=1 Tax=unclassified Sulfurospirillum TaxID=2618290 RepID=UPI00050059B6|nr:MULTISPECIES: restriction endonuclease subunit S [unclassified Sulfurospirillum]KFL33742.1 hypothetical protein JU57_09385 [Sulfurospirillum sp. SCADC]
MPQSKTPHIRFKGFSGEWKKKQLGDIADIIGGGTPSTSIAEYWGGNIDWYSPTEIGNQVYANGSVKKITQLGLEKSSAKILPSGKTILFTSRAGIGNMAILSKDGATNQGFQSLILRDRYDTYFIYSAGFLIKKYALKYSSGSTFLEISGKQLSNMNIIIPNIEEQTKIGEYFQRLDVLIEQKEKKYQKLKQFKTAMLSQLFPQEGEYTPKLRFKGFSGEWEKKILDEIVNRYDNLRVPISAVNRIAGNTPYYGANGIQDYVKGHTHDGEFILIAEDGANDLKNYPVQYVNGKIWVNNHAHVLQAKMDIADNVFLKFALSKINIEPFLVGGGRAKLNANIMMDLNIKIPSDINEQTKIGNYFQKLDTLIDLHQQELEKLKTMKKALLAKMFV